MAFGILAAEHRQGPAS